MVDVIDSGDEKPSVSRSRTSGSTPVLRRRSSLSEAIDDAELDELMLDQAKYPAQHEPGKSENFYASEESLRLFREALTVKLQKYGHLNLWRNKCAAGVMPLALSLIGFMQFYWPGKVSCCGMVRDTISTLEKHINRSHRPPKGPPVLALAQRPAKRELEEEEDEEDGGGGGGENDDDDHLVDGDDDDSDPSVVLTKSRRGSVVCLERV